jgi:predicted TIM-barrel fold metal-dependent hydrolase
MMWSGAFERHPKLTYILTETGVGWILEKLRVLEFKAQEPMFKHFTQGLTLGPTGYFRQNCFIGASFLKPHEARFRHEVGVDKLMWGSDYPHLEGTWPNTMKAITETFGGYPEDEIRDILGRNAARIYGFDVEALRPVADEIGPTIARIRGEA